MISSQLEKMARTPMISTRSVQIQIINNSIAVSVRVHECQKLQMMA